jgi:hypothetical protein
MGQTRQAAILFGALDRYCGWVKSTSSPAERDEYEQALTLLRASLGEEVLSFAWTEGQALTLEQAMVMA